MDKENQARIISELTGGVIAKILVDIVEGKVPEAWDGFELRHWVASRFAAECRAMPRQRMLEYKELKTINNL
jgi:hypothetical protein